jgi:segregation and condensation protein B
MDEEREQESDSVDRDSSEEESSDGEVISEKIVTRGDATEDELAPSVEVGAPEFASQTDGEFDEGVDEEFDGLSLDDLGAAYARVAAEHDPEAFAQPETEEVEGQADDMEVDDDDETESVEEEDGIVTPESIVEAALFVGHPENKSMSEQRLASLMRDVSPEEIIELIEQLNHSYREADQALRIIRDDHGYRMTVAPEVEGVRRSFLGKVRETRLSQTAIEVLALVAYQPGVTSQKVQDQRGRESGSLLNQLVRRQLLRMERVKPEDGGRAVPHYYPTERFLVLFGLESLEDLPHVEEGLREG